MAIMDHLGREYSFTVDDLPADHPFHGVTFKASRLDRDIWADWLRWARTSLPDPIDVVIEKVDALSKVMSREEIDGLIRSALEEHCNHLSITSPRVMGLFESPEGGSRMLWLLLRPNHPELTEPEAIDLFFRLSDKKLAELLATVEGKAGASGKGPAPADSAWTNLRGPSTGLPSMPDCVNISISAPGSWAG